ncbi:hypothetical protein CJF42_00375 [Pseudoalteromonas sp. NBT06-2]|uniref:hypothetical protein n=1 Tax=Pseudoalteromonas sp. NBT06-2 TaxID=2025950 RepID=UPI000BA728DF|nr:hypothetical protein [Pseudoalteromonas sp. NBT06-2]PAJ76390.1 hypothetical protein CJF42_00375 [Pseudoalteromonas sp. NBT06-2]
MAKLETENQLDNLNGKYYPVPQAQQSIDITDDLITNEISPLQENQNEAVNEKDSILTIFKIR